MGSGVSVVVLALQGRDRHRGVELRGGNGGVPQEFLDHSNVGAVSEHVRRATVTKDVSANSTSLDAHRESPFVNDEVDPLTGQRATSRVTSRRAGIATAKLPA